MPGRTLRGLPERTDVQDGLRQRVRGMHREEGAECASPHGVSPFLPNSAAAAFIGQVALGHAAFGLRGGKRGKGRPFNVALLQDALRVLDAHQIELAPGTRQDVNDLLARELHRSPEAARDLYCRLVEAAERAGGFKPLP